MVTALNVANNVLDKGFSEKIDISPMKLQKLIYLVYKEFYQNTGKTLFAEPFEVWKYGSVLRSVYDEFKQYGGNAIKDYCMEADGNIYLVNAEKSENFKSALDGTWQKYKRFDGIPLSEMTHKKGTAWWKAATAKKLYLSNEDILKEEPFIP